MNREIKFRGFTEDKDGDTTIYIDGKEIKGRWVYGYAGEKINAGTGEQDTFIMQAELNTQGAHPFSFFNDIPVIPQTVGQWSGKIDKNGKDVYEDDRLLVNGEYCIDDEWFNYQGSGTVDWHAPSFLIDTKEWTLEFHNCEYMVTGNTFETPE